MSLSYHVRSGIGRRRAFTSVELMGAVVLSMILSVVAITSYRLYERELPVKYAARRLSHAMATARTMAVANSSIYTVQIDRAYHNFWIDETDEFGQPTVAKVVSPESLDPKVQIDGVQFGSTDSSLYNNVTSVRFFSDGSSDDVSVTLKMLADNAQDPKNIFTVRLYGPTGQSKVFERQRLALATP